MDKKHLWSAYEAAAATGGILCARGGDPDSWEAEEWAAAGIAIDSRSLKPGEIFVALSDVRDGHEFIDDAFNAGASAALVREAPVNAPEGKPFLVVRDTLEGLRDLARAARLRNFGKRIAVTGSAGKTSTKDMLRAMLSGPDNSASDVHAADRSFNNHFGVPLTLARMPKTSRYGIFEIGMNHAGEITPLVDLVRPHAAIVTTVAAAHLEFFDSVEEIAEAKAEIFTGIRPGGAAIIPLDNPHYSLLRTRAQASAAAHIYSFGRGDGADAQLLSVSSAPAGGGQQVSARLHGQDITFVMGAPGLHQAMNALAGLLAATFCGVSVDDLLPGLETFTAGEGRGGRARCVLPDGLGEITLIDESYNANPASMAAAFSTLAGTDLPRPEARRIAVLGHMLELGPESAALHAGLLEPIIQSDIDRVYVTGDGMDALWEVLPASKRGGRAADPSSLLKMLTDQLHDGDIIMVKGSNASKVSVIADALRDEQG